MFEFFKKITEDYKWMIEMSALASVLLLFIRAVRKWICVYLHNLYVWFTFPFKSQDIKKEVLIEILGIGEELKKNTEISEQTAKDVTILKEIVGHNGGGGLLDMVGVLTGLQTTEFFLRAQPGYICDQDGRNLESTHAYLLLLRLSSKNDLAGLSWKSYMNSEKSTAYLNEFKDASSRREGFRERIELFDIDAVSKGFWISIAHPISAEGAKSKRYVGFLYPADEKAREIAKSYNWPLSGPL